MNFLSNAIGYGASQDAEQAKSALLQQAARQAQLAAGNAARHERFSKESALAQLGLAKYQGDEERRMKEFLASQANTQRNKEFDARLAFDTTGQSRGFEEKDKDRTLKELLGNRELDINQGNVDVNRENADSLKALREAEAAKAADDLARSQKDPERVIKERLAEDMQSQLNGAGAMGAPGVQQAQPQAQTGDPFTIDPVAQKLIDQGFARPDDFKLKQKPGPDRVKLLPDMPSSYDNQPSPPAGFKTWQDAADQMKPGDVAGVHGPQGGSVGGVMDMFRQYRMAQANPFFNAERDNYNFTRQQKRDTMQDTLTQLQIDAAKRQGQEDATGIPSTGHLVKNTEEARADAINRISSLVAQNPENADEIIDHEIDKINATLGPRIRPLSKADIPGAAITPLDATTPQTLLPKLGDYASIDAARDALLGGFRKEQNSTQGIGSWINTHLNPFSSVISNMPEDTRPVGQSIGNSLLEDVQRMPDRFGNFLKSHSKTTLSDRELKDALKLLLRK